MARTIDRENITATHGIIRPYVRVTPVLEVDAADIGLSAFRLVLKLEHLRPAATRDHHRPHGLSLAAPPAGEKSRNRDEHGTDASRARR